MSSTYVRFCSSSAASGNSSWEDLAKVLTAFVAMSGQVKSRPLVHRRRFVLILPPQEPMVDLIIRVYYHLIEHLMYISSVCNCVPAPCCQDVGQTVDVVWSLLLIVI